MTINFIKAFKEIIEIEGARYTNDPNDKGGETKYGISKRSYPNVDIKNLTLKGAQEIYYKDYWCSSALDYIDDYSIALEVFECGVNTGRETATRFLQESLNLLNRNEQNFKDLVVDGKIGFKTIDAYSKVDKRKLLKTLNIFQGNRYIEICKRDKTQEKYFNGWLERV